MIYLRQWCYSHFSRYGTWRTVVGIDGRADSHVTSKFFEIDRLPILFTYGALLVRLRHAGTPQLQILQILQLFSRCYRYNRYRCYCYYRYYIDATSTTLRDCNSL